MKRTDHHFHQLASLYDQFAEDITDEALAKRLGAPMNLDENDAADAAMLAGMPAASTERANALHYLALLDLNQDQDFSADAKIYGCPDTQLIIGLLDQEIGYIRSVFEKAPSLVKNDPWCDALELCLMYRTRFADDQYTLFLPKRLS